MSLGQGAVAWSASAGTSGVEEVGRATCGSSRWAAWFEFVGSIAGIFIRSWFEAVGIEGIIFQS